MDSPFSTGTARILLAGWLCLHSLFAHSAGSQCETLFSPAESVSGRLSALEALSGFVNGQRNQGKHRLSIKDGKGFVEIGFIARNESLFNRLLLRAIKSGAIAEVNGGDVIGPKVLNMLNRIRRLSSDSGEAFVLRGTIHAAILVNEMRKQVDGSRAGTIDPKKGEYWTENDIVDFQKSIKDLELVRACVRLQSSLELGACGPMGFEISTDRPEAIRWYRVAQEDAAI